MRKIKNILTISFIIKIQNATGGIAFEKANQKPASENFRAGFSHSVGFWAKVGILILLCHI
jgi:hypothetical protein